MSFSISYGMVNEMKIKRTEMINDYAEGGLKMLDMKSFNRALTAKWIQRYLDPNNKGNGNCS